MNFFNVQKKNKKIILLLLFNSSRGKLPHYSLLHGHKLEIVEEVKYLGGHHSDMKFTAHIQRKLMTANQQLSSIIINKKRAFIILLLLLILGSYHQCQTACLQDSLPPSYWVCSSCLGLKQQERYTIRHRTPKSSSAIYSWYQGEGWRKRCQD